MLMLHLYRLIFMDFSHCNIDFKVIHKVYPVMYPGTTINHSLNSKYPQSGEAVRCSNF